MKIALDLDNTIINYANSFVSACSLEGIELPNHICSKQEIKNFIRNHDHYEWPMDWIKVQGRVYGEAILDATVASEVLDIAEKFDVTIVSHKSEMSLCGRYNLREQAQIFLQSRGLGEVETIFLDTLEEKIKYLSENSFDIIVDDLEAVLDEVKSNAILLHYEGEDSNYLKVSSWEEVLLIFNEITDSKIEKLATHLIKYSKNHKKFILKGFRETSRLERELYSLKYDFNPRHVEAIGKKFLIFKYEENLSPIYFDIEFKNRFIEIYKVLQEDMENISFNATDSALEKLDYKKNIDRRMNYLDNSISKELETLYGKILSREKGDREKEDIRTNICFPDFYRENFYERDGNLLLMDFESFGRDDLSRTFLNAIHHFGHDINNKEESVLIDLFTDLSIGDASFWKRVKLNFDLVAFEWLLIASRREENLSKVRSLANIMSSNIEKNEEVVSWKKDIWWIIDDRLKS